ncbi:hypothetical protein ACIA8R_30660 [Nonomuraea sp. NPDC051191]
MASTPPARDGSTSGPVTGSPLTASSAAPAASVVSADTTATARPTRP